VFCISSAHYGSTRAGRALYAILIGVFLTGAASPSEQPRWTVDEETVPLTGAVSVTASLPSNEALSNMIGQPERAILVLRCRDNVLSAFIGWPEILYSDLTTFDGRPQTDILWRLDDRPISSNFWLRSDAGNAAGMFSTKPSAKLIEKLVVSKKLVVRMTGRVTQDATFILGDIVNIAAKVGAPCGVSWTIKP